MGSKLMSSLPHQISKITSILSALVGPKRGDLLTQLIKILVDGLLCKIPLPKVLKTVTYLLECLVNELKKCPGGKPRGLMPMGPPKLPMGPPKLPMGPPKLPMGPLKLPKGSPNCKPGMGGKNIQPFHIGPLSGMGGKGKMGGKGGMGGY